MFAAMAGVGIAACLCSGCQVRLDLMLRLPRATSTCASHYGATTGVIIPALRCFFTTYYIWLKFKAWIQKGECCFCHAGYIFGITYRSECLNFFYSSLSCCLPLSLFLSLCICVHISYMLSSCVIFHCLYHRKSKTIQYWDEGEEKKKI